MCVVVEGDVGARDQERPRRPVDVARGEDALGQEVARVADLLGLVGGEVERRLHRSGGVEERAELCVEVVEHLVRGEPHRTLIEDDVPLGDDVFGTVVQRHLVGDDGDVLVLDRDAALHDGVFVFLLDGVAAFGHGHLNLAALFLRPRLELELRLGRLVELPGRTHVFARLGDEDGGSNDGEEDREEPRKASRHLLDVIVSDPSAPERMARSMRLISWICIRSFMISS